jgi:hypothetical protein
MIPRSVALLEIFKKQNYIYRIIAILVHPGAVDPDIRKSVASTFDRKRMTLSTKESAEGFISVIDNATIKQISGHFMSYDGVELAWYSTSLFYVIYVCNYTDISLTVVAPRRSICHAPY